jgi:sec-independent protein translocase protein TatB
VSLGPGEILIVAIVALIVLGPDKLPQAARNIAKFYKEIRSFSTSVRSQVEEALEIDDDRPKPPSSSTPVNPDNPDTSGFTLVDAPPANSVPEPPKGAPLFQPDPEASVDEGEAK